MSATAGEGGESGDAGAAPGGGGANAGASGAPHAGSGGESAGSAGSVSGSGSGSGGAAAGGTAGSATSGNGGGGQSAAGFGGGGMGGGNPSPVCGNELLESGEQCDDGNTARLDGCDASCAFEESQRANWFKVQFDTDTVCRANGFGSAFPTLTRSALQQQVDARVADGSFSLLFAFLGLTDPKAPNGSSFSLGVLSGTPAAAAGYDGKSDLDWWYKPAAGTVDANGNPLSKLSAQITSGTLQASGLKLQLPLISSVPLSVSGVLLQLPIGASSTPLVSSGGPPGHLPAEHLSPSLTSMTRGGAQTDAGSGKLCGNIAAASLKTEQIPPAYLSTGATPCSQGYSASNSFLDFMVGGCTLSVSIISVTAVNPTQPDQVDPSMANPGAGGPYRLTANAAHVVSSCRDKSNTAVPLADCLAAAAYSSSFELATDRVIIK